MGEKEASARLDVILIEGRDSIRQEDLLKYIRPNCEGLSLKNIESLQKIISPIQEEILEIVENNSYLENEVKM